MPLNSTSVIKVVDLLCEGEIQGIFKGKRGIFLNETPVQTGSKLNVPKNHFDFDQRKGTKDQAQLKDYQKGGASNLTNISEELGENYSETVNSKNLVTKRNYGGGKKIIQITDPETTSVQFLFTIPSLFCTAMEGVARGQLFNAKVRVKIHLKSKGSGFNEVYDKSFTGISTSDFQFKTPPIDLTEDENGKELTAPFQLKIVKFTNKENDYEVKKTDFEDIDEDTALENTRGNRIFITSMIERQDFKSRYPFTACVGLSLSTETFSSLPTRSYLIKGLKVAIPHNAIVRDDGSLKFNGSFDGSLLQDDDGEILKQWTTCPVCIFYDMLTSDKHGAGDFIKAANISWVDLYPLAQYANQLVSTPDGDEPRFAINTVIAAQNDAYKVLQNLASTFRGMTYWAANTVNVGADHGNLDGSDVDPVHIYNNANVIGGVFNYSGTSLKTRSTSIRVRYNDPDNLYKPNVVVVEDYDLITKYGYQVKDLVAFGCSSKYQAQRLGTWMLKSEELDADVIVFQTGLDGLAVLPTQIFAVADEMRSGTRLAGRVGSGSTTSHVVVDQDYTTVLTNIDSSTDFISLTLADGTVAKCRINAITSDGRIQLLGLTQPSSAPLQDSVYVIERSTIQVQKFRCIDVIDNNDGTYTIEGVQFNDSIYAAADENSKLAYTDITAFDETPTPPVNLQHTVITTNTP
tara:strand:- start:1266 stop:3329 length:2064 start_codon:yes stop_codon:yes gene_type:complete